MKGGLGFMGAESKKRMKGSRVFFKTQFTAVCIAVCLGTVPVIAEGASDAVELKKQVEALQKRIEELEREREDVWNRENRSYPAPFGFEWDPFEEMGRMQNSMRQMFQDAFGGSGGASGMFSNDMFFDYNMDLKETEHGYEMELDLSGLDEKNIDIQVQPGFITLKGEHARQDTEERSNAYVSRKQFGSFMKTIPLPPDADTTKMTTEKKDGVLVIRISKSESRK